jgi:hypothetical protein
MTSSDHLLDLIQNTPEVDLLLRSSFGFDIFSPLGLPGAIATPDGCRYRTASRSPASSTCSARAWPGAMFPSRSLAVQE